MLDSHMQILTFWFLEIDPNDWFGGGERLDQTIRDRFGDQLELALRGELSEWEGSPRGRLALILLLDQMTRNAFRGTARMYAGDKRAQALALSGIDNLMDRSLNLAERQFFYMPLMHAESADIQELSLTKFSELEAAARAVVGHAANHASTVREFGRFPRRNTILGRADTDEEARFLENSH